MASVFSVPLTVLLTVIAFLSIARALPLAVGDLRRDVADPPVTAPNASTIWVMGETQTVVWDTTNLPSQITNTLGTILLGFMNDTTSGEHLMTDNPLAKGFDIRSGSVNIIVPDVESRTDYIIALLGDSGNISDKFTILNASGTTSVTTSTSSITQTSAVTAITANSGSSSEIMIPISATSSSATTENLSIGSNGVQSSTMLSNYSTISGTSAASTTTETSGAMSKGESITYIVKILPSLMLAVLIL